MKLLVLKIFVILVLIFNVNASAERDYPYDKSVEEQYEFGTSLLKIAAYEQAEKVFQEFVRVNPTSELAGSAQYWYAETLRIRDHYIEAGDAYLEGYQKYPNSNKGAINLLKLGMMMVYIGEWDIGCKMINGVKLQYPTTDKRILSKANNESVKMCRDKNKKNKWVKISKPYENNLNIAQKEPSQTQNSSQYVDPRDYVFCAGSYYDSGIIKKNKAANNSWYKDCKATIEEYVFVHLYERIKKASKSNKETVLRNDLNNLYALFKKYPFDQNIINKVIISEPKLSIFKKIAGINSSTINNDIANLDEERRKIEEEKKKIEEEKRKIAEAKKKQEEEERQRKETNAELYIIGSGTGFFVSAEGHIVSNDHVVGICRQVASKIDGEIKYFNIIKTDEVNDLGLVKGEYKNPTYLSIKTDGAEYGEDIVAFGYPLADALSTSVKLTRGIVSSLSGPGNNYSEIQIDAAIQPGNSGGPVLNMEGQVVGVASSGLNKLYMLKESEYIPENVNFAVAAPTLSNFLKANGVKVETKKSEVNNTKELARIGRPATLQLFCMNTKAVFEELKETKKHSDVLFEKVIDLR